MISMRPSPGNIGLGVVLAISMEAGAHQAVSGAAMATGVSERVLEAEEGYASYYSRRFDGNKTASGAVFDSDAMLAAHPNYPFGTVVRVTNLRNHRSVTVRIVDRGPSRAVRARGGIIDVSRAAAHRLGFIERGRARVRLEVLTWGR
jgi:rare lipoprotein A